MRDSTTILGICRFSMLGRGDWKAYSGVPDSELERVYAEQAVDLFDPQRLEDRLAVFEKLTLASLKAQTDPDFRFLVISSDRMPAPYRKRLISLCAGVEQVELRFVPPSHVTDVVRDYLGEKKISLSSCIQFRLDDDDCVASGYIERLRQHARTLWSNPAFGVSFSRNYYCVVNGPTAGIYDWSIPFFSAGAAIRHPTRIIFEFGHFAIPTRLVSIVDPQLPNIVTYRGDNDTPRQSREALKRRGMKPASDTRFRSDLERHFGFIGPDELPLCGLSGKALTGPSSIARVA